MGKTEDKRAAIVAQQAAREAAEREARRANGTEQAPRKARVRKRTRAGVSVHGTDGTQPKSAQSRPAQSGSALASQAAPDQGEGSGEHSKPRRRRRRSGRGRKDSAAS